VSVYLLHLAGLIWTSDFKYAFKDLRIKLPLLLLPLILSTGPLIRTVHFRILLLALITGVTVSTAISFMIYAGVIKRPVNDIRDICIFISHIRLALLCCLSLFAAAWLIATAPAAKRKNNILVLGAVMVWLVYFLFLIESLTGIAIIIITGLTVGGIFAFRNAGLKGRIAALSLIVAVPVVIAIYIKQVNRDFIPRQTSHASLRDSLTASGTPYEHHPGVEEYENGNEVWTYLCEPELENSWNARSDFDYRGRDQRNQELRMTLIRFLTSKGLRKDQEGIAALSDDEVRSVERGIANVQYQQMGNVRTRVHQVLWELHHYKRTGNPSGHSASQRIEYWKAALSIIAHSPVTGVGTGDVISAFARQYDEMQSQLTEQWRLRAHNQYLSMAVAFGLPGLALFMASLLIPLMLRLRANDYLYISLSIISIISMLTEDTLETQAGVTFFAFFTSLFLFVNPSFPSIGGKRPIDT
jgi:hypothetical protein